MILNPEQQQAVKLMNEFLCRNDKRRFFLLSGAAGTGKTSTIKELVKRTSGRIIFTAPTNKATKVLRETFQSEKFAGGYSPECRTIYSLLKLRMEAKGEIKELAYPEDPVDISKYLAVVVDEGSMISKKLESYIKEAAEQVKFIFMADEYQLPPVNPNSTSCELSPIWSILDRYDLKTVMRHDNQILSLATDIRNKINHPCPSITIKSNFDESGGVRKLDLARFLTAINKDARSGLFNEQTAVKAIAWRNVTVDYLNKEIRKKIFSTPGDFFSGDRIILTEPAKDFLDETGSLATTDDEGTIERSAEDYHPLFPEIKCYRVLAQMDSGHPITLWGLHPSSMGAYSRKVADLAEIAKVQRYKWKDYWEFREAFHKFRYGYAITAHRAQGSTYDKVFVHSNDILQNRNRDEAFRCLYVACTRPRKDLVIT